MKTYHLHVWKPALYALVILAVAAIPLTLLRTLPVQGQDSNSVATLNQMSTVFTEIAEKASPAVVSIQVEKEMRSMRGQRWGGRRMSPNAPPGLEDFLERFFGQGLEGFQGPEQEQQMPEGEGRSVPYGQGTGFIISSDGYIVTNNHVVGEADKVRVQLADGREFDDVKIVGTDPQTDVALLKVDVDNLPTVPMGNSDDLKVAEWVLAIGSPFGLSHSVTAGIVSAIGRGNVGVDVDYADFIQTDAAINPGNSGGPLLNLKGEVVGMNTAILSRTGGSLGIGFAIPINMVKYIKDQLIDSGSVQRGFLGVNIQPMTPDLAKWFPEGKGVLIGQVSPGSPAEKAGIQQGDVVVEYDGHPVEEVRSFQSRVSTTKPGETVELVIARNGERQTVSVTLGTREQEGGAVVVPAAGPAGKTTDLGFQVGNLTDDIAQRFGFTGQTGVIVSQVNPNSEAAMKGLKQGLLIQGVNRKEVHNVNEFNEALKEAGSEQGILLLVSDGEHSFYVALDTGK